VEGLIRRLLMKSALKLKSCAMEGAILSCKRFLYQQIQMYMDGREREL